MPIHLTNSKNIVANSVSITDYNNVVDIMDLIGQINNIITYIVGTPPLTMNTLDKISRAINNDPHFDNVIINLIHSKLPSATIANYYTKAAVQRMFLNLIDNAPASLDTLNELANALADDANFATTIQNQLALKASITYVDSQLAFKQPTITSATNLARNKLITRTWESPTGFVDFHTKNDQVYVGNTLLLSATSTAVESCVPTYAVEGLIIGESESPVAVFNKNGNITTQGSISSGNLTAQNIYTKTEVDNLLPQNTATITTSTNLAINKLITRTCESLSGLIGVQIKADQVYFGTTQYGYKLHQQPLSSLFLHMLLKD